MGKFRKKPVVIEACQWFNPGDEKAIGAPVFTMASRGGAPYIPTLEGPMYLKPGDWIIRGVKGEYYPCKPDIFDETYEAADD